MTEGIRPSTFSSLELNITLNQIEHVVEARCVGLSDNVGLLGFTSGLDTVNHVATKSDIDEVVEVPVLTMDELCAGRIPSVIKIDVEGYEQFVLGGASQTLKHSSLIAVILEINSNGARYGVSDELVFRTMKSYGFLPHGYEPLNRRLEAASDEEGNTIFLRDVATVERRVHEAPRFQLINGEI